MTTDLRKCGDCQLCCKLLPVEELAKASGARCSHARHGKGCTIYAQRPSECRAYVCGWLAGMDDGALSRPDRAHYILDLEPTVIQIDPEGTGKRTPITALVIWADAAYPDAHRNPALRAFLETTGLPVFVRRGNVGEGTALFPPKYTGKGWVEWEVISNGENENMADAMALAVNPDGRLGELSRMAITKIFAVEGITITAADWQRIDNLKLDGLNSEQRAVAIAVAIREGLPQKS